MENVEFNNACYEVLEILKHVKEEDLLKIPKEEIQILKNNANYKHNFTYDLKKDIKKQEISKMAKGIIAVYFYKYTASKKQREKIKLKQEKDLTINKQETKEKYSYEDMFKRKTKEASLILSKEKNVQVIECKPQKLYIKLINKIKKLLNLLLRK